MFSFPHSQKFVIRLLHPILYFCFCNFLSGQQTDSTLTEDSRLRIFIECDHCDLPYYSENFSMVQFITEPVEADVFVSINEQMTGYGYSWTSMVFYGKKRFILLRDTLEFLQSSDVSLDDKRMMQLEKIKLGLVPYLLKTPDASRLFVMVDHEDLEESIKKDPWNHWAFSINGMGSFYQQENYRSLSGFFSLYITRITEKFKFESQNMLTLTETSMELVDPEDSTSLKYKAFQRGWSSNTLAVKSLGSHAGFGALLQFRNDYINNLNLRVRVGPAIEYNIFPYSESLKKQIRFLYACQYEYAEYVKPTIYNSMQDENWRHQLSVIAGIQESWGSVTTTLSGSSYVKQPSKYSLNAEFMTMVYVPVVKGLSLNVMGGMSMYRDRINQAGMGSTPEDMLIYQQAMEQDYRLHVSFGITYRFGSRAFPALNARFSQ